jgi:hypothetical protein
MLAERFQHPGELTHCESALSEMPPDRGCTAGFRGGDRHNCAAKARDHFGNHPLVLAGRQTRHFVLALRFRCRRISPLDARSRVRRDPVHPCPGSDRPWASLTLASARAEDRRSASSYARHRSRPCPTRRNCFRGGSIRQRIKERNLRSIASMLPGSTSSTSRQILIAVKNSPSP